MQSTHTTYFTANSKTAHFFGIKLVCIILMAANMCINSVLPTADIPFYH